MGNFRNFKNFPYLNKKAVYLIAFGYMILMLIIVLLSVTIREKNQMIILYENRTPQNRPDSCIDIPRGEKLIEREYRMRLQHRMNHR